MDSFAKYFLFLLALVIAHHMLRFERGELNFLLNFIGANEGQCREMGAFAKYVV